MDRLFFYKYHLDNDDIRMAHCTIKDLKIEPALILEVNVTAYMGNDRFILWIYGFCIYKLFNIHFFINILYLALFCQNFTAHKVHSLILDS